MDTFETFVVIGGGTSSILLTYKLLEFANVMLIEQGDSEHFKKCKYCSYSKSWASASFICKKCSKNKIKCHPIDSDALSGRVLNIPSGNGLGGSSNINASLWIPPSPNLFNYYWPDGWKWNDVSETFDVIKKLLNIEIQHSVTSSNHMSTIRYVSKILKAFNDNNNTNSTSFSSYGSLMKSNGKRKHLGYLLENDIHGGGNDDVGMDIHYDNDNDNTTKATTTAASRSPQNINEESKKPIPISPKRSKRGTLHLFSYTKAEKLEIENIDMYRNGRKRVTGVRVSSVTGDTSNKRSGWRLISPSRGGEVVVCAGVHGSRLLLERSGLLPPSSSIPCHLPFLSTPYTPPHTPPRTNQRQPQQYSPNNNSNSNSDTQCERQAYSPASYSDHVVLPVLHLAVPELSYLFPSFFFSIYSASENEDNGNSNGHNVQGDYHSSHCGVHGIVNLDEKGQVLPSSSSSSSKTIRHTQILLVDGFSALTLAPELLLPRFSLPSSSIFHKMMQYVSKVLFMWKFDWKKLISNGITSRNIVFFMPIYYILLVPLAIATTVFLCIRIICNAMIDCILYLILMIYMYSVRPFAVSLLKLIQNFLPFLAIMIQASVFGCMICDVTPSLKYSIDTIGSSDDKKQGENRGIASGKSRSSGRSQHTSTNTTPTSTPSRKRYSYYSPTKQRSTSNDSSNSDNNNSSDNDIFSVLKDVLWNGITTTTNTTTTTTTNTTTTTTTTINSSSFQQKHPILCEALDKTRQALSCSGRWSIELLPGCLPLSWYCYLFATSYYHPVGSVPMSQSNESHTTLTPTEIETTTTNIINTSNTRNNSDVDTRLGRGLLDNKLRLLSYGDFDMADDPLTAEALLGADNQPLATPILAVRVADASAIPYIPDAPPAATCMMIGYRCAELLQEELETRKYHK